ncbi:Subtilisin-like protease SBT4.14, partial [Mucuna pruriens]
MAPATIVNSSTGYTITKYIQSTRSPSAVIYKSHEVKMQAPITATFSSRGPNPGSQNVLKPDAAALTSWQLILSREYILLTGTSMACPHVVGVAAYVKSFHPNWTRATIRSAVITI